ncbi:hypothetical protein [Psychrobacter sp. JCM 18902]|uniref:hypothetical protein n=1 Tax=Psychrobacter sp. JCM 18902 TaxID=1298607 RepID=UPI00191AF5C5|nr:hypothetical protein [Psychrobacter sp. JCM 18902]
MPDMTKGRWETIWYFNETNPMNIQPTTSYIKRKRARRPKAYKWHNGNAYLNNYVKHAFFTIVIVNISILLFVKQNCGATIYEQLLKAIFMQALCLCMLTDSKLMLALASVTNRPLSTMRVAAFFIMLGSFYLFFITTQGLPFQNGITGCG